MKISNTDNSNRDKYVNYYLSLPEKISVLYSNNYKVTIKPHYIRRLILDDVAKGPWDTVYDSPAYQHMTTTELKMCVYGLQKLIDPKTMIEKIEESNKYRSLKEMIPHTVVDALNKLIK